jgi:tRNA 2-thiouridine synthesizing protein A
MPRELQYLPQMPEKDNEILDATGLLCPLPSLRTRKRLKAMEPGATLLVRSTDPRARDDVPALCALTGDTVLGIAVRDGVVEIRIRKN